MKQVRVLPMKMSRRLFSGMVAITISLACLASILFGPGAPAMAAPSNYTCTYYLVRRGDTLSAIGLRYGVTIRAVMSANGLRSTRILAGSRLCIPRYSAPPPPPRWEPRVPPSWPAYNPCPYGTGVQVLSVNGVPVNTGTNNCQPPNVNYPPANGAFPCTRNYFNASNLCVQQPYPVKVGATAYAVWNITDFVYGEFDMGDGRGYIGPIAREQQVAIPNVTGARLIQLRWQDKAGNWQYDSMTIQVTP
jgi:LysM repeat protein